MSIEKIIDDIEKLLEDNDVIEFKDITLTGENIEIQGAPGKTLLIRSKD